MKLIIAGSRTITLTPETILDFIKYYNIPRIDLEVVSGGARGIDGSGDAFARKYGYNLKRFNADWETHGKAAGPIRNKEMADYADALLLIWDGKSRGSLNMKTLMYNNNKSIFEVQLRK